MLVPTMPEARYLILDDADLASLVSVALAAERWGGRGPAPVVVPAWWRAGSEGAMPLVHTAAERHAGVYGLERVNEELVAEPGHGPEGFPERSAMLLDAAGLARRLGCDAVLFPVRAADLDDGVTADAVAREVDRAALVSRLAALDLAGGGCSIVTPLVDFDDEQLIDLARDLSVPTETCWWSGVRGDAEAGLAAERWASVRATPAGPSEPARRLVRTA